MAESIAHFAVKSIGLSRVNGRKPCTLLEAARHNLREIQAEQGAKGHIDPMRTHGNTVMHGPASAAEVCAQAEALQVAAGIIPDKLRRDHCQAIEAVFSLPQQAAIPDPAAYFAKCLAWLAGALSLPVLSAVVHRDESATHLHVLLLPVKDGAHVGGAPIDRAALKRLRENFFAKVAGPAGLKHAGAKVRGMAKQWAIAAVLQQCEVLGLPAANGPLWPYVVACIERDPTGAMLGLDIDANTIRPSGKPPQNEPPPKPIGIEANPIGFQTEGEKHRTLSCVGFAQSTASKQPTAAVTSLAELWSAVDHRSQCAAPHQDRLRIARAAQQRAIARHSHKSPSATPAGVQAAPAVPDGWTGASGNSTATIRRLDCTTGIATVHGLHRPPENHGCPLPSHGVGRADGGVMGWTFPSFQSSTRARRTQQQNAAECSRVQQGAAGCSKKLATSNIARSARLPRATPRGRT